jgi:hypothetical protein
MLWPQLLIGVLHESKICEHEHEQQYLFLTTSLLKNESKVNGRDIDGFNFPVYRLQIANVIYFEIGNSNSANATPQQGLFKLVQAASKDCIKHS